MLEIASSELPSFPFDHHGLIAAVCKDLKFAERIDVLLPVHEDRVISPRLAVVAFIQMGR